MANAFLEALKRQKLTQMSHQPQPLPPDLLGALADAEGTLYDKSMIYKALKDAVTAPGRAYRGEIDALGDPRGAMEEAMNTAGMAQLGGIPGGAKGPGSVGMITYHGSPHKFDKFDMSKIGTGEGAQAYGHGLYFAEAPEVAQTYGRSTTPGNRSFNSVDYNGQKFPAGSRDGELLYDITTKGRADVIRNLQSQADRLATINPKESANLLSRIEYAKTVQPDAVRIDAGNLYKVDIPDESIPRMLDWDKPLSDQAPEVIEGVTKALRTQKINDADIKWLMGKPASQVENFLMPSGNRSQAAENLKNAGIPGIRYLDGGSRTAGDGTSNFVLFDDQLPRILERNGEATGMQPWQPGEANALLGIPSRPRNALNQEIPPTQYELAHQTAQRNAALPVEQGGLGLPEGNTAMDRALAMGFDTDSYHGTSGRITRSDINEFDLDKSGMSTGARSAKEGSFSASNPEVTNFYSMQRRHKLPEEFTEQDRTRLETLKKLIESAHKRKDGDFFRSFSDVEYAKKIDGAASMFDKHIANRNKLYDDAIMAPWSEGAAYPLKLKTEGYVTHDFQGVPRVDNDYTSILRESGDNGAILKNTFDPLSTDVYVSKDPSRIRSRFAAFDPMKRDSADLLATLAPYAIAAPLLSGNLYDYLSQE